MSSFARRLLGTLLGVTFAAGSATAQLLPGLSLPSLPLPPVGNVPVAGPVIQGVLGQPAAQQAVHPTLDTISGLPGEIAESGASTLLDLRRLRLQELIRENRNQLEAGDHGQPVRRGVLVALDPDAVSVKLAARAGFALVANDPDPQLGMRVVEFAVPRGMSAREGLKRLRKAAPGLQADYDPVYEPAGGVLLPFEAALAWGAAGGDGGSIGMIDGGVASSPALAGARIEQNGFAGSPHPTGHGTAVASLLVGNQGRFHGAAVGASLYVADVYGGNRAAGSASAIVRALGWLLGHHPKVINISLVGPSNALVQRAIRIVQSRGVQVVAAVGNDGPAAPPQYPASYGGVVAVTGVDARGRALPEAGKAAHLDFAAPGADMAAALPGRGFARVRGTSFAAPLVSARLFASGSIPRLAAEARPGKGRVGRGIVCGDCRIDPRAVGAK